MRISDWSSDVCSSDLVAVAHHPHRAHRQQHRERLPDRVIETRIADFFEIDRVGLAQDIAAFLGDLAGDADREAGAGKRMAADEPIGKPQFAAESADFVLEQFAPGLDELPVYPTQS